LPLLFPRKRDGGEHIAGRQWLAAIITIIDYFLLNHPAARANQGITAILAEESALSINLLTLKTASHLVPLVPCLANVLILPSDALI
jgi:hypothetical protein